MTRHEALLAFANLVRVDLDATTIRFIIRATGEMSDGVFVAACEAASKARSRGPVNILAAIEEHAGPFAARERALMMAKRMATQNEDAERELLARARTLDVPDWLKAFKPDLLPDEDQPGG